MQELIEIIKLEQDAQMKIRKKLALMLRSVPEGHLVKKKKYCYWRVVRNGKVEEKYLGAESNPMAKKLKKKRYMQVMAKTLDRNLEAMEKFLDCYKRYDLMAISERIGKTYKFPPGELFEELCFFNPSDWETNYDKSTMYPENLTMTALNGQKVRSKSELIIINQLILNNVKFQYEPRLNLNGWIVAPDFRILAARENKIYIHEHFGMMDDPKYRRAAMEKIEKYMENGFVLWDNLTVTFDGGKHELDSRIVSKLIQVYYL